MDRVGWSRREWLVAALGALALSSLTGTAARGRPPAAGDDEEEPGKGDESGGDDEPGNEGDDPDKKETPSRALTPREIEILQLFHASKKSFEDGKIVLSYDFMSREEDLLEDWTPKMAALKPKIHWSTSGEAYVAERESTYKRKDSDSQGLVLSDNGQWMHKAVFLPDLEVSIEILNLAIHRPGTMLGPIFSSSKKKEAIGVNGGFQFISLNGGKPAKPLLPLKTDKVIQRMQQYSFGYRLQVMALDCIRSDKPVLNLKLSQAFDSGHVGLFWAGSIQCFIFNVTVKGRLDPDWVAGQLGEKKADAGKASHVSKK
jgi:hypothetical protein